MRDGSMFDSPELRHWRNKARAALTRDPPPEDSKKTLTLEVRPEEVKVLYARALALQSLVDGWLDPREIEYLHVFMSRVSMSSDSREEVRQALAMHPFDNSVDPDNLAADQEVEPTGEFDALLGGFWPEDEGADEFVIALRGWRHDDDPEA